MDASEVAVGCVLFQLRGDVHEMIAFASHKFSEQAFNWDLLKKEAFAI